MMKRKPRTFDAVQSLRPSSALGRLSATNSHNPNTARPLPPRPAWDSTVQDLTVHKLSRAQQLNRKASVISKNRSKAREEWLEKQQKLLENPQAEREVIRKLKPLPKPKTHHKEVAYPYYHQQRLYNKAAIAAAEEENQNPNGYDFQQQQTLKLRQPRGSIKFTPATAQPAPLAAPSPLKPAEMGNAESEEMELCAALNASRPQREDAQPELDRWKEKYLAAEDAAASSEPAPRDYLDISENLKNLEKLKAELSQPYGSSAVEPTPLDPFLTKYAAQLEPPNAAQAQGQEEGGGIPSLISGIKRDPLPFANLPDPGYPVADGSQAAQNLFTNTLLANPMALSGYEQTLKPVQALPAESSAGSEPGFAAGQYIQPNYSQKVASEAPPLSSGLSYGNMQYLGGLGAGGPPAGGQSAYGYDSYIPEPRVAIETRGSELPLVGVGVGVVPQAAISEEAKIERMRDMFFSVKSEVEAMGGPIERGAGGAGGPGGLQWEDGAAHNRVRMDVFGQVGGGGAAAAFCCEEEPEEPRMYPAAAQAASISQNWGPHVAGAADGSMALRSHYNYDF